MTDYAKGGRRRAKFRDIFHPKHHHYNINFGNDREYATLLINLLTSMLADLRVIPHRYCTWIQGHYTADFHERLKCRRMGKKYPDFVQATVLDALSAVKPGDMR